MSANRYIKKSIHFILVLTLVISGMNMPQVHAGEMVMPVMPAPGTMVSTSLAYIPAHLMGMTVDPKNALKFDFLIHQGQGQLTQAQKQQEYTKLVKYFLASLTIPDKDQWVNLSPYEKNRIIEDNFGKTEMGRDLLAQDYLLKQISSSLMYPESGLGKTFWDKVYAKAGNANIPVNTFNKVWIVPDQTTVYESKGTAYIIKSHLKVMLEEDYLAVKKNKAQSSANHNAIRQIILPELEREVNEGKNFAQLRQIVSSMILATWYKKSLKESLLGKVYADTSKMNGLQVSPNSSKNPEYIYQQYLTAFKKGVFNYIKDTDSPNGKSAYANIPRKYFAGGFQKTGISTISDLAMLTPELGQSVRGLWQQPDGMIDQASFSMQPMKDEDKAEISREEELEDLGRIEKLFVEQREGPITYNDIFGTSETRALPLTPKEFSIDFNIKGTQDWSTYHFRIPPVIFENFSRGTKLKDDLISAGYLIKAGHGNDLYLDKDIASTRQWMAKHYPEDMNLCELIFDHARGNPVDKVIDVILSMRLNISDGSMDGWFREDRQVTFLKYFLSWIPVDQARSFAAALNTQWVRRGLNKTYGSLFGLMASFISLDPGIEDSDFKIKQYQWASEFLKEADLEEQAFGFWLLIIPNVLHLLLLGIHIEHDNDRTLDAEILTGNSQYDGMAAHYLSRLIELQDRKDVLGKEYPQLPSAGKILTNEIFLLWGLVMAFNMAVHAPYTQEDLTGLRNNGERIRAKFAGQDPVDVAVEAMKQVMASPLLKGKEEAVKDLFRRALAISPKQWSEYGLANPFSYYLRNYPMGVFSMYFRPEGGPSGLGRDYPLQAPFMAVARSSLNYVAAAEVERKQFEASLSRLISLPRPWNRSLPTNSSFTNPAYRALNGVFTEFYRKVFDRVLPGVFPQDQAMIFNDEELFNLLKSSLIEVLTASTHPEASKALEDLKKIKIPRKTEDWIFAFDSFEAKYKQITEITRIINTFINESLKSIGIDPDELTDNLADDLSKVGVNIKRPRRDNAMLNIKGGIDLNSSNLNMVIKRDGNGMPLPLAHQDMAQLSRIKGFEPVLLSITPVLNLPILQELK